MKWLLGIACLRMTLDAAAEVVQLYVAPPGQAVPRAPRSLKGFERVELEPGEHKRVTLDLPHSALAFWEEEGARWRVEPGRYGLLLGGSSRDIRQRLAIDVTP